MKKIMLSCLLMTVIPVMLFAQLSRPAVIAYYTGDSKKILDYPVASLTHLIYSFMMLDGDTLAFKRPGQQEVLRSLVALKKQYPSLKVQVALGGWGGCKPCSPRFALPEVRKKFAASVVNLLNQYNADGLDLDWEYPGIEGHPGHPWMKADVANFTELVREIRAVMGNRYELSFAAGGFTKFLEEAVDWQAVMPLVDRVNLMTYDLVSGFSTVTGHHTPLHATAGTTEATDHCVEMLARKGVPLSKMIIGAAFYARSWKDVPAVNNGLYQPGVFKAFIPWKDRNQAFDASSGYVKYWDENAKAPYYYNAVIREFATLDDKKSIAAKTKYMLDKKLGGIMFWELTLDEPKDGLLDEIIKSIQANQ